MLAQTLHRRKRVNFMLDLSIIQELEELIPAGTRSDFINGAVENALVDLGRRKAIELIDQSIKKEKKFHTTKKILTIIHNERRY